MSEEFVESDYQDNSKKRIDEFSSLENFANPLQ